MEKKVVVQKKPDPAPPTIKTRQLCRNRIKPPKTIVQVGKKQ